MHIIEKGFQEQKKVTVKGELNVFFHLTQKLVARKNVKETIKRTSLFHREHRNIQQRKVL